MCKCAGLAGQLARVALLQQVGSWRVGAQARRSTPRRSPWGSPRGESGAWTRGVGAAEQRVEGVTEHDVARFHWSWSLGLLGLRTTGDERGLLGAPLFWSHFVSSYIAAQVALVSREKERVCRERLNVAQCFCL